MREDGSPLIGGIASYRLRRKGGVIRIDTEGGYLKKISRSVQDSFLLNDRFDYRLIAAFLKYYVGGTPVCTLR